MFCLERGSSGTPVDMREQGPTKREHSMSLRDRSLSPRLRLRSCEKFETGKLKHAPPLNRIALVEHALACGQSSEARCMGFFHSFSHSRSRLVDEAEELSPRVIVGIP